MGRIHCFYRHWWVGMLVAGVLPSAALAQAVDYQSLETLFGEPVTTGATGKPQKSSEAPVGLDIITSEQIRRMGVNTLPEIIGRLPGITNWRGTRSWSDVGVRGQNASYNPTLLVLINGRQVYVDSFGFTDWTLIPVEIEEIRQIEVIKGPATALYGFNAVNGVINIITYNPKYDNVSEAGTSVGSGAYKRAYGYKTFGVSDAVSMRVSAGANSFNDFSKNSKTTFPASSDFQDAEQQKVAVDSVVKLTDATQLRLETSYARAQGEDVTFQYVASHTNKDFFSGRADLTSETSIGQVEANLYTNIYDNKIDSATPGSLTNQITVAQLQDLFKLGTDHTFRIEGEYRRNKLESDTYIGPGAEIYYDNAAISGMWSWALRDDMEWTNALRIDHLMLNRTGPLSVAVPFAGNEDFDQTITTYGANSSVVWKATSRDTWRASYGRGIQAPSLSFLGGVIPISPTNVSVGNPDVDPTIVTNYEIGYDRGVAAIGGKWRSSVFYRTTDNINAFNATSFNTGGISVQQVGNVGDTQTVGFELGLDGIISPEWKWDISYIYQNSSDTIDPLFSGTHASGLVSHHSIDAHISYTRGPWQADLYGEADSPFKAVEFDAGTYSLVNVDNYTTLGARIAYTFEDNVTLALSGTDLSQARTAESYGLEAEREVFLSLSKKF